MLLNRFTVRFWSIFFPAFIPDCLRAHFREVIGTLRSRVDAGVNGWSPGDWDHLSQLLSTGGPRLAVRNSTALFDHLRFEIPVEGVSFSVYCDTKTWSGVGMPPTGSLKLDAEIALQKIREVSTAKDKRLAKRASERSRILREAQALAKSRRDADRKTLEQAEAAWQGFRRRAFDEVARFRASEAEFARLRNAAARKKYELTSLLRGAQERLQILETKREGRRILVEKIADQGPSNLAGNMQQELADLDGQCAALLEELRRARESGRSLNREIGELEEAAQKQRTQSRNCELRFDLARAEWREFVDGFRPLVDVRAVSQAIEREWKLIHAVVVASGLQEARLPEQIRSLALWHLTEDSGHPEKAAFRGEARQFLQTVEKGCAEWDLLHLSYAGEDPPKAARSP